MKSILGFLFLAAVAISGTGCIIVDERDDRPSCERCYSEGVRECGNNWDLDECIHGCWETIAECDYDCDGLCVNVGRDDAVCDCY